MRNDSQKSIDAENENNTKSKKQLPVADPGLTKMQDSQKVKKEPVRESRDSQR